MNANRLADFLGNSCYLFLTLNLLWGLYCAALVWRRLAQLRFRSDDRELAFQEEIEQAIANDDFTGAIQLCENDGRALPQLASVLVQNRDLKPGQLRHLISERLQRDVVAPMENRVNWILTVIRNGPLLGLMGTVLGMMAAFGRIGQGEKVQPSQIADEISVALICTAMGLGTAIPLGYVASSLTMRIRDLQESLSNSLIRLMDRVKGVLV